MTKLLLRLFVPDAGKSDSARTRARVGRLSGIVGIACNVLLFALKLLVGILSGSVSVTADAMNNLSDASGSIVTLVGFKLAEKPADEEHPYGHARFEYLSGLAVAAMIVVIGFELAKTSVEKMIHPEAVAFSAPLAAVLVGSIAVKLWLFVFNRTLGRTIGSQALLTTAADSRNDVVSTAAVLAAAVLEALTGLRLDGWMGFAVALFILYSGASLAKETISPLLGEAASPELKELIVSVVTGSDRVLGYHDLMVHDYGPGQRFASIHVEMDRREDALVCHEIIDNMERECLEKYNIHLVIHYDPIVVGDPQVDRLRAGVAEVLGEYDARLHFHDFRIVQAQGHTNVIFDVALPGDLRGQEKQIRSRVEEALTAREGTRCYAVITFDPAAFNTLNEP